MNNKKIKNYSDRELLEEITGQKTATKNFIKSNPNIYQSISNIKEPIYHENAEQSDNYMGKIQLLAEFCRRYSQGNKPELQKLENGIMTALYLQQELQYKEQENFIVISLNIKNEVIGKDTVFIGTKNNSTADAREIFKTALSHNADKIIIAHNHPDGDSLPSDDDVQITKRINLTGQLLGIPLTDHIIITQNDYFSFYENNLLTGGKTNAEN